MLQNNVTPIGAQVAMRPLSLRSLIAQRLMNGQDDITTYKAGVCYDAAAYVRYLLGAAITPTTLAETMGPAWLPHFNFQAGAIWRGRPITRGTAVGFERKIDMRIFHAAIAIGGTEIRGINAHLLSPNWVNEVDLAQFVPGPDGWFTYDNTAVRVRLSNL